MKSCLKPTDLFEETFSLLEGIVQLGVSITDFLSTQKGFESFTEPWSGTMPFGEWGHYFGMSDWENISLRCTDESFLPMNDGLMQRGSMNSPTNYPGELVASDKYRFSILPCLGAAHSS